MQGSAIITHFACQEQSRWEDACCGRGGEGGRDTPNGNVKFQHTETRSRNTWKQAPREIEVKIQYETIAQNSVLADRSAQACEARGWQ